MQQGFGSILSRSLPPPPTPYPGPNPPMMGLLGPGATMPPARAAGMSSMPPPRSMETTALLRPGQSRFTRLGLVAAGVAIAIVAGVIVFLLPHTGRIVVNVTDPKGAGVGRVDIYVDGRKQCDTAPCIVEQQSAGAHEVKVLADGYEAPAAQGVNVEPRKGDSMATFVLGSAPKPTGIKVGGTQPGVKLYVDDKEIGPLPQDYRDMTPGDHVVKIVGSERYQPLERRVSLDKDKVEDLGTVTLKVLKGKITITLATPGARVFLASGTDRREIQTLPISVDIDTAKNWSLQANRPGYTDYVQAISFDDGQAEKTYVVTLEPRGAPMLGNSWVPATPQAPPSPFAQTPRVTTAMPQPAGPAPQPAPQPVAHTLTLPTQPPAAAQPAVAGGEGFLNMNSIPPSTVFLDGKQLGPTPRVHVSVPAGVHQVKFVNAEQQLTKTITVSVGSGETKLAVAKLSN
jgi:serine/threonine-protein kinase